LVERGLCRRFAFDFYDSELERFGGPEGVSLSEEIFHADSEASSELTTVLGAKEWLDPEHRTLLLVLSVHDLIDGFGLDESGALDWYQRHSVDSKELGEEYRKFKNQLRVAVTNPANWLAARPLGDQIKTTLRLRRRHLSPLLVQLHDLEGSSTLQGPIDELCASYVHLHPNRLGAAASEGKILNFLRRTCASLSKAPVKL
jgi:thiopeptide-type bacteriocin biosynthesis protein